jgi:glycosyltransferase involved in cell wall biosynthesis
VRIVLVADEDPGWGGIGTYTAVMGQALRALGHDAHLVLRGWEKDGVEEMDGLPVHRVTIPAPSWRRGTVGLASRLYVARESLIFSHRVARVVRRIRPDVIEAPEFHAAALTAALHHRLRRTTPSVVVRLHTPSFMDAALDAQQPDLDLRALELLEASSAHCASLVSAPADALARVVRRRWRLPARRLRVVPNPIDEELFAPSAGADPARGSILVVGRVERHKGQDVLLEALPAIRRAVPEAHVELIGDDGGQVESVMSRAAALGVRNAVRWEGARPRQELPAAYRAASVCVVPSRFENFPYTCLEAMSCGRAVVASRAGGLPEVISDGNDGLLVAPENPAELAEAVSRVLLDESLRLRLGDAARARVRTSFTARIVAQRMSELYAAAASDAVH